MQHCIMDGLHVSLMYVDWYRSLVVSLFCVLHGQTAAKRKALVQQLGSLVDRLKDHLLADEAADEVSWTC